MLEKCLSSAYRAMIDIRGYVMLSEFVLDKESDESFVIGIGDSGLHAVEGLDQEPIVQ